MRRAVPLTRALQGLLSVDGSKGFMGAAVWPVWPWSARVDRALYETWRVWAGCEPPRRGPPSAAASLSATGAPRLSNAIVRAVWVCVAHGGDRGRQLQPWYANIHTGTMFVMFVKFTDNVPLVAECSFLAF